MVRKKAWPNHLVVDDATKRRRLVEELLGSVRVNKAKLLYHGVPEDVAIAGIVYAKSDVPDPHPEGWYQAIWDSPRGQLKIVYFMEVREDGSKVLAVYDAYPIGREHY